MVHTGIFATALQCQYKAGVDASAASIAEALINSFCSEAESFINVSTDYNWSDAYSALNTDVKAILQAAESAYVGNCCIAYDQSGYSSKAAVQTLINRNYNDYTRAVELLKLEINKDFTIGA
jgi:hypothetical protein